MSTVPPASGAKVPPLTAPLKVTVDPEAGINAPPVTAPENVGLPVRSRLPAPLIRPEKFARPLGSLIV